jgi:hypothetical protein
MIPLGFPLVKSTGSGKRQESQVSRSNVRFAIRKSIVRQQNATPAASK